MALSYQQEFLSQVEDDIKYLIELHWDEIALNKDSIKLNPDWDAYFAGIRLIKFAEKCLKEDGVSVLTINIKVHKPFDKVLERLKFKHIERVYSKYLKGE